MRRRKPCTLARRRLFGWKVRLLMDVLRGRRWACRRSGVRRSGGAKPRNWLKIRAAGRPVKRGRLEKTVRTPPTAIFCVGDLNPTPPEEYVEQPAARPTRTVR